MEQVTLEQLTSIVRDAMKRAGCTTSTVSIQRYDDPSIPSNWDRDTVINYGRDDPNAVEATLRRITRDLQRRYRLGPFDDAKDQGGHKRQPE
jgi:hypothetical protein